MTDTSAPSMPQTEAPIETPSGKGAGDENFPVGSWLLPARLRPHVARYYAFARAIDDIADNPDLPPEEKIARLDLMAAAIEGRGDEAPSLETARTLRRSLLETQIATRHATDLTVAFKQDAVKLRYSDWTDLMGYCENSANPVGRYLLDLHGEDPAGYGASDALCSALQVINHLQDCQDDYRALDRVYLPGDWLDQAGATLADLDQPRTSPALRQVLDRCLDETEVLLTQARALPARLISWHLALESAVILRIAERLAQELRVRDPLAERVMLSKAQVVICGVTGAGGELLHRIFGRRRSHGSA